MEDHLHAQLLADTQTQAGELNKAVLMRAARSSATCQFATSSRTDICGRIATKAGMPFAHPATILRLDRSWLRGRPADPYAAEGAAARGSDHEYTLETNRINLEGGKRRVVVAGHIFTVTRTQAVE